MYTTEINYLDNSNLVSYVKSVVVSGESDISLLLSVRSDEGVDLLDLNIVLLLDSGSNFLLVSSGVDDEHEGVVVLNLLHGRLGGEWPLEDTVVIQEWGAWGALSWVLGVPSSLQSLWSVESHGHACLLRKIKKIKTKRRKKV